MRKRDLGILLISAFACFISLQHESNVSFREAWYHIPMEEYDPVMHNKLQPPPPIVADLNGDGRKEVIFVTTESRIQVVEPANPPASQSYQVGRVLKEVGLNPSAVPSPARRHPVAMSVGYLDPPIRRSKSGRLVRRRKAVLAVVTSDWGVMCFDHNLKLMWETSVQMHMPVHALHREVSVLVTNHTMHKGDRGVVIVGGSVEAVPQFGGEFEGLPAMIEGEEGEAMHRRSALDSAALEDMDEGTAGTKDHHFSYYAFEGGKGTLMWKHESKDFHRDMAALSEKLEPQHNYKLDANALTTRHFGELECRDYRDSILRSAMPHRWVHRDDTKLELASFHRHRRHSHKRHHKKHRQGAHHTHGTPPRHLAGRDHHGNPVAKALGKAVDFATTGKKAKAHDHAYGNNTAHHWWAANSIVAHLKEGIEIIHLYSGRTVCKLLLPEDTLHADVNGDGVIDHVKATGAKSGERYVVDLEEGPYAVRPCWGMATSGIPEREELFNGSICRPESAGFDLAGLRDPWEKVQTTANGEPVGHEPIAVAVPIHMPVHREKKHARQQRRRHSRGDVIFLNSKGEVTSYSTEGIHGRRGAGTGAHAHMRWQIVTAAHWTTVPNEDAHETQFSISSGDTVPTLAPMALRVGGHPDIILAVGESSAVLISVSGNILSTVTLPTNPVKPVLVQDFNGDGLNDILIPTSIGIYGFIQTRQPGALFMSSLVGCLIIILSVAFVTLHLNTPPGKPRGPDRRSTD